MHRMELPRKVVIGRDAIKVLGKEAREAGERRALVVTSETPLKVAGSSIMDSLEGEGVGCQICKVGKPSTIDDAQPIIDSLKSTGTKLVVAVGGGRVIDVAKVAVSRSGAKFFSVPTTASHDGICSPLVSFPSSDRRYSFYAATPTEIIADTKIIANSPYRLTASGCGDVMAKLTAVREWRLSHLLRAEYAATLAETSVSMVVENSEIIRTGSEAGVRVVMEALIHCGIIISVAGSSRPCSGSEHLFSHALDVLCEKPALHGEQVGVGTIMMAYLHGADWKLVRDTLKKVGAPTNCRELGIDEETVVKALVMAHTIRPDRYTILGEKGLSVEAAENLVEVSGVAG
ncbi:MAG: NAD(P)-dependent glycerol-1-phosphate dehydrogenase [Candidatus Brockarchaeota archaeon]|nr:NAD(P)-dependent glycerol-1-phosphate dehydrogenase [Candidatus Brockarchaeota archaeon]